MSRAELIAMAKQNLAHARAGTIDGACDIARVPASHYFDSHRFSREIERVWRRLPLMLATTAELPQPGDYKSIDVVGVPVLLSRGQDGRVRAFMNICSHRGSVIVPEGRGSARRFSCPYHAWTYDEEGALTSIYRHAEFGDLDKSCHGLTRLPVAERAGLVWVTLDPRSTLDIDAFLCGYDALLAHFGFATWHHFASRRVDGPNWKIAYDGYLDLYHLPILHRNTFGPRMPSQALYTAWGPHQRVSSPDPRLAELEGKPEESWNTATLVAGVWTIFPHVSIASFDGGGRGVMISQLFPGESATSSYTIQNYLMERQRTPEQTEAANAQFALLEHVVRDEDYATGLRQQRALMSGGKSDVLFGRNEGGGQRFHAWLDRLLATEDGDLGALFAQSERPRF